jgi:divalent metal cation (Fe/Co/Zn/Cd) transporter
LLISLALIFVGIGIGYNGITNVIKSLKGEILEQPSIIALIAALVSIIIKEGLFSYTKKVGTAIKTKL